MPSMSAKDRPVPRVPVFHLTRPVRLPLIEEQGLRTRADLSGLLGPVDEFDQAAPGTFARGKRVSGYLDRDHAAGHTGDHGVGLVTTTVDPAKALANTVTARADQDPDAYWAGTRPLATWLAEDDVPADLEVHVNVGVRAKFLQLLAPLVVDDDLGDYAGIVHAAADEDRLSAKALMHLAVIASEGDFDTDVFRAACALAWRDQEDEPGVMAELVDFGPDKIASAALAEFGGDSPEATLRLREVLDETREWADDNGLPHGQGILARTALVLDTLPAG